MLIIAITVRIELLIKILLVVDELAVSYN